MLRGSKRKFIVAFFFTKALTFFFNNSKAAFNL